VRISDSYVFPAKGLTLISIEYPPADQYLSNYEKYLQSEDLATDEADF